MHAHSARIVPIKKSLSIVTCVCIRHRQHQARRLPMAAMKLFQMLVKYFISCSSSNSNCHHNSNKLIDAVLIVIFDFRVLKHIERISSTIVVHGIVKSKFFKISKYLIYFFNFLVSSLGVVPITQHQSHHH